MYAYSVFIEWSIECTQCQQTPDRILLASRSRKTLGGTAQHPACPRRDLLKVKMTKSRMAAIPRPHRDGAIGHHAAVEISPSDIVRRRRLGWDGLEVEIVQVTRRERIESRFHSPVHLLVLGEHGERSEGETLIEGLARSSLHKYRGKFTFIPAGHKYCDWQVPRTLMRSVFFYLHPDKLPVTSAPNGVAPRLFFENASLWDTATKLVRLIEHPGYHNRPYFEALGVVLAHELACLGHTPPPKQPQIRGGLAAWQERTVAAYIEEHLDEQISLAALAQLTRLSPILFLSGVQAILRLASTPISREAPRRARQSTLGSNRAISHGDRNGGRLQRDEFIHSRLPEGHRAYPHSLSPELRLVGNSMKWRISHVRPDVIEIST